MALDVTATITCDLCGRSETRPLRESFRHGSVAADAPSIVREFPHWELLGRDGYSVTDPRVADGKVLCEGCAARFRSVIRRQHDEMNALFEH